MSKVFLNNTATATILSGVRRLITKNGGIDLAVSYVQVSGWNSIAGLIGTFAPTNTRLLVTDQFDLTHPNALRLALQAGIQLRCYVGDKIYHPKVYLSRNSARKPVAAIVGSGNLSDSGLSDGIEGAIYVSEPPVLRVIGEWFDAIWNDPENILEVDDQFIRDYRLRWRPAAGDRIKMRRSRRRRNRVEEPPTTGHPEDIEVLEDVCETIRLPLANLSIDQAGNNVRNLNRLLNVLHDFPNIEGKPHSELHLLGLVDGDDLTDVGRRAKRCRSVQALARVWCEWLKSAPDEELDEINLNLAAFRRAATMFWRLHREVRNFFFANLQDRDQRPVLMAIELLCNAGDAVRELKLEDFTALVPILGDPTKLPAHISAAIQAYRQNKGARSWADDDRRIVLEAWNAVR